jgi:PAS domain S-box-containing protein
MAQSSTTIIKVPLAQRIANLAGRISKTRTQLERSPNAVPPESLELLADIALDISELSKKVADNEDERQDLLALVEISQVVNSSLDLGPVLQMVMDTVVRLSGAERGFLMLNNDAGELEIQVARNWAQETVNPSEFAISRTVINRVAEEGQAVLTTNAQEDPRFGGNDSIVAFALRSILCVPMFVKNHLTGVLYADNRFKSGLFTESELSMLEAFANQAAIAIENARLFESVRKTLAEVTDLKNLMDNVFASIASGVITANVEKQITLCNQAAQDILGQSEDQMVGNPIEELLAPIAGELSLHMWKAQHEQRSVIGKEFNLDLPVRGNVDLRLNISPLRDASEGTQGVAVVVDDLTEQKRLEGLQNMFERMVSPTVIGQLDPDNLQLGGERGHITTLFVDIRGFTSFSERLNPMDLVSVLNKYLSVSADAILSHQGTIDKFMGDAVMAWFNAPIPQPDHAARAVRAALGIRDAIEQLHRELPPDQHLNFGAGLDFGEAVLGLVGSEKKLEYTAIGDTVNTAKRLQENSEANQIIVSQPVVDLLDGQFELKSLGNIALKGKSETVAIYEIC